MASACWNDPSEPLYRILEPTRVDESRAKCTSIPVSGKRRRQAHARPLVSSFSQKPPIWQSWPSPQSLAPPQSDSLLPPKGASTVWRVRRAMRVLKEKTLSLSRERERQRRRQSTAPPHARPARDQKKKKQRKPVPPPVAHAHNSARARTDKSPPTARARPPRPSRARHLL